MMVQGDIVYKDTLGQVAQPPIILIIFMHNFPTFQPHFSFIAITLYT